MVDAWESLQDEYQRTAVVLDHFDEELNAETGGGVTLSNGSKRKIRIMLLAGGDLIQSMGEPGVWADVDVSFFPSTSFLVLTTFFSPSSTTFLESMAA
jgi:nicotinamide mononucleotide adenylyltransferase